MVFAPLAGNPSAANPPVRVSPIRWVVAWCCGSVVAVVLWGSCYIVAGLACFFVFGKDEVPPAADFLARAAPWVIAAGGGILCGRLILTGSTNRTRA